jgi:hypothetical protein
MGAVVSRIAFLRISGISNVFRQLLAHCTYASSGPRCHLGLLAGRHALDWRARRCLTSLVMSDKISDMSERTVSVRELQQNMQAEQVFEAAANSPSPGPAAW